MDKAWKAYERWVAKLFNTERIPVLGDEDADVVGEGFWIDCKLRREVPSAWFKAMSAAETLGYNTVAYHDTVFMRVITAHEMLCRRVKERHVRIRVELPCKPLEWLSHITESCPRDMVAAVVMNVPRTAYAGSLLIADADQWLGRKAIVLSARGEQGG